MKPQSSLHAIPREVAVKPKSFNSFWDEVNATFGKIEKRAYELFEGRGRENGHDLDDWFKAESELLRPMPVEINENDNALVIKAEVPGFKAEDLNVSLEPTCLIIKGKLEEATEKTVDKTVYSESQSKETFRKVPLPFEVNPDAGEAFLRDGVLEIKAPKAPGAKQTEEARKIEVAA
jgi:HSP20 family protein